MSFTAPLEFVDTLALAEATAALLDPHPTSQSPESGRRQSSRTSMTTLAADMELEKDMEKAEKLRDAEAGVVPQVRVLPHLLRYVEGLTWTWAYPAHSDHGQWCDSDSGLPEYANGDKPRYLVGYHMNDTVRSDTCRQRG